MSPVMTEELARSHIETLHREAGRERLAQAALCRTALRRRVGYRLVDAGIWMATGLRDAARAADARRTLVACEPQP